jgi:hypothetical protein
MKFVAIILSLLIPASAVCQPTPAGLSPSTVTAGGLEPLIVTALPPGPEAPLKIARATGGIVALSGVGLMVYAVLFVGTGPIGWATGLIFFGGLTAYLAHRRLKGDKDFKPDQGAAPAPAARSGADAGGR